MSTIPTLALIPSGVKASKVYSVLPTDGSGDFTFSRSGALPSFNATRVNKDGLIEEVLSNVPRLNYPMIDGVVSGCPSLLLEPQRSNLLLRSEEFDNIYWQKLNTTVTSNTTISPDGTLDADTMTLTDSGSRVNATLALGAGTYTLSCYVKKLSTTSGSTMRLLAVVDTLTVQSIFTPTEEWVRYSYTFTATSSVTVAQVRTQNLIGEVAIWGVQLEAGSYPTSYIPTQGSSVTRVAEICNGAGDATTFNDSEGVLFVEISAIEDDGVYKAISISDGTVNGDDNRVQIAIQNSLLYANVRVGNVYQFFDNITISVTENNKIALKYKTNDFAVWLNGSEILTDNSGTTFSSGVLSYLGFADGRPNISPFLGNVKQIQYFDTALTDQELQQLTSL
jgi:hypothetical protein